MLAVILWRFGSVDSLSNCMGFAPPPPRPRNTGTRCYPFSKMACLHSSSLMSCQSTGVIANQISRLRLIFAPTVILANIPFRPIRSGAAHRGPTNSRGSKETILSPGHSSRTTIYFFFPCPVPAGFCGAHRVQACYYRQSFRQENITNRLHRDSELVLRLPRILRS